MPRKREPPVILTKDDYETLSLLAEHHRNEDVEDFLLGELARARILPADRHDPSIVRIGSKVCFRDLATNIERDIELVMPNAADISKGKVSVLTSVGVALIGLAAGETISFTAPDGRIRAIRVIKVTAPTDRKRWATHRAGAWEESAVRATIA